jgi:hypothetical protein
MFYAATLGLVAADAGGILQVGAGLHTAAPEAGGRCVDDRRSQAAGGDSGRPAASLRPSTA